MRLKINSSPSLNRSETIVSELEFNFIMDYFKLSPENRQVARQSALGRPIKAARCYHAIFCSLVTPVITPLTNGVCKARHVKLLSVGRVRTYESD